jgi:hypothetical protein
MNNSPFRPGILTRLGVFIAICATVGLTGCSSTVKMNYVNWEVQFKQGTSELDKEVAMDSVRRYILHFLSGQADTGYVLKKITFDNVNLKDLDRAPIGVALIFGRSSTQAVPPPKPGGGGPGFPRVPDLPTIPNVGQIVNAAR